MRNSLPFEQSQLVVSPSWERTDAKASAHSHSHRGFSPVIKGQSRFRGTVLTVFRYALKDRFCGYRIFQNVSEKQKTVKTVLRIDVLS
jgi:hypothetical protein